MSTAKIPSATQLKFNQIAASTLGVETLETRKSDRLDFQEVAVWDIKKALQEAYLLGVAAGKGGAT